MLNEKRIWIISGGRFADIDPSRGGRGKITGPVKEYRISDIAWYLLNPEPIEVERCLIGCDVDYRPATSKKWRARLRRLLPGPLKRVVPEPQTPSRRIRTLREWCDQEPNDPGLRAHIEQIRQAVRPCHNEIRDLAALDPSRIANITGICSDLDGNHSSIRIPGKTPEQIEYMIAHIGRSIRVTLQRPFMGEGLFELKGYDFTGYRPENSHRLLKYFQDGASRLCLIGADHTIRPLDDHKSIQYLQLLEQSVQSNPELREILHQCVRGRVRPMKLFFDNQLEIDYTGNKLPKVLQEVFETHRLGDSEKAALSDHLNRMQVCITLNYIPRCARGGENIHVEISVMQDIRALEPIREKLPLLYTEMAKRAVGSEGGRYYLLDAIRGVQK